MILRLSNGVLVTVSVVVVWVCRRASLLLKGWGWVAENVSAPSVGCWWLVPRLLPSTARGRLRRGRVGRSVDYQVVVHRLLLVVRLPMNPAERNRMACRTQPWCQLCRAKPKKPGNLKGIRRGRGDCWKNERAVQLNVATDGPFAYATVPQQNVTCCPDEERL